MPFMIVRSGKCLDCRVDCASSQWRQVGNVCREWATRGAPCDWWNPATAGVPPCGQGRWKSHRECSTTFATRPESRRKSATGWHQYRQNAWHQ